ESYITQLSVYAHAASQARNVPVRCFVDFVSQDISIEVILIPMEDIEEKVEKFLTQPLTVDQ
ncbi:MAG: hypothetical protein IK043_02705, partial [Candidatus Methanomethylophilaceae archaeon]|nr:hypothetical protein [Candidatus Methanomethylophilaceae archaeon]